MIQPGVTRLQGEVVVIAWAASGIGLVLSSDPMLADFHFSVGA